jgi:4-diphosphocytidyl-2-C-methyl-D-erythritol kinase
MIRLRSFAKINLGLEVTGRRPDGYHTLRTVFQTIDLCDELEVRETRRPVVRLAGSDGRVAWDGSNSIARAFRLVHENFRLRHGFDISVRKNIPPGSGLGGGSGNAAVMLLFLNQYFALSIPRSQLNDMAAALGADVPFFLAGGTALGEGIGDELTPLCGIGPLDIALFIPERQISTALVFSRLHLTKARFPSKIDLFLRRGD